MTIKPYIILIILAITMILFIWGRWRYDIVALIALMISVAVGAVPFNQAYTGLSNPAVITVACVMVISHAITRSGILNQLVRKITLVTQYPVLHIGVLSLITAFLSAFMNNVGALALMMPIAIQTAIKSKRSPAMVLMPLALASALGGLVTMIGTPPNLLVSAYRQEYLGQPFAMFDYSHVGLPVAIIGIVFITFIGWRLLPKKRREAPARVDDIFPVQEYITEIKVPTDSPLANSTVGELEKLTKGDVLVLGVIRGKQKKLVIKPNQTLEANDVLIVETSPDNLQKLLELGKLELVGDKKITTEKLRTEEVAIMEAVVPQASRIEGRSSQSIRLRSRFNINLLAISRAGKAFKKRLRHVRFKAGDVVLLQGPVESLQTNAVSLGLLPLLGRNLEVGRRPRAIFPLLIFITAIVLAATQLLPVQIAFGGAVLFMVLFNVLPVRALYENIDWSIIILLAAMIPIGGALQSTGGTALISHYFMSISGQVSPTFILVLLMILTMTLSDFMNNAATTVVMAPIAVSIAQALKVNIDPFLMAVAIGASCSFLTPVGHQNNTLVMGPGGYKFWDYIRMGLPLEIIILIIGIPLLLWAWPITH